MARILVVDDESLIRVLVADVGESLGHEVLTAASIKEGQDLAQRGVDIVLLDVLLPDGDGLAHVETFSQLPGRPDVIIITGHGNADAAEAALRSGAWEYLVKPLRVRDLSKALTQEIDDFSIVSCSHGGQFAQIKRQGRHFFLGGHAAYGAFILNRKRRKNLFGNRAFRRSGIVGNGVPGVLGQKAGFGMPQRRRPCRKSQRNHNQTTDNDLVQHEKNLMC